MRYCGRLFREDELEIMRGIIKEDPNRTRARISRLVCKALGWYKPDNGLKDMSCRVAMIRMHEDGLLTLPPPRNPRPTPRIRYTEATAPQEPISIPVEALPNLRLMPVSAKDQSALWNEYVHRYHYLGYSPLPGAQLRYMVMSADHVLALLGFGAAAWQTAPRDQFIGWNEQQRRKRLHLIVNNARLLILPWIHSKNLASKILSMISKKLPGDWQRRYGYRPVLLETFVQSNRYNGTSYKAANWIFVGQTRGIGKKGPIHPTLPKKDVLLYPLTPAFRKVLTS
ncbi:MAG: DUF4338 domain-containing protein [Deltaproteobacteria bacterium]|nr:DUF4338 domain-containing protein [Deltaproteobacteria bacterium]